MKDQYTSPQCPWCGDEADDTPNEILFDAQDRAAVDCAGCGKPITITRDISITYLTVKRKDDDELMP